MGTRSNRVFHGDSKSGASAMVRRTESPLLKNGIFHASWKARTLRKNGGVIGGTTALTAGGSSKWNKRSSRFAAQWHVHGSPCILANHAADLRLPLCKRPGWSAVPGKRYPRCFAAGAADDARRELEAWQNSSCSIGRKKQCTRIHNSPCRAARC